MGFLDSLEDNLKSLEANTGRDEGDERRRREQEKVQAMASAPHSEQLRQSPFTMALLDAATRIGFGKRLKVNIAWIGSTLRLEARERRLELRPTSKGVQAVFIEDKDETSSFPVNLATDKAQDLAEKWLNS